MSASKKKAEPAPNELWSVDLTTAEIRALVRLVSAEREMTRHPTRPLLEVLAAKLDEYL